MIQRPEPLSVPLFVSRPNLPPFSDYTAMLRELWDSAILTNGGAFHEQLEAALVARLGSGRVSLWNNGTTALIGALSAMDLKGEVIVTPFTFPATVHAIALLGLAPVFADIDPDTMTIAPTSIAERSSSRTSAIVGTHVYGISCDTAAIGELARGLSARVIYDGAHSFGRPTPIFPDAPDALGDVTMLSFHATKLFHTVEGGALITQDAELDRRFRLARNFGIKSETETEGIGLNGKMSELHAAMGLCLLATLDTELARRAELAATYARRLAGIAGLTIAAGLDAPKQYFVIRVSEAFGSTRDQLFLTLREMNVHSRRYFFPLVSDFGPYSKLPSARHLPNARRAAQECLALPFYGSMTTEQVELICDAIEWQHATASER